MGRPSPPTLATRSLRPERPVLRRSTDPNAFGEGNGPHARRSSRPHIACSLHGGERNLVGTMDAQRLVIEHTFVNSTFCFAGIEAEIRRWWLNPYPRAGRGRIDAFQSAGPDEEHER
jgi:hypothetical protein